MYVFVCTTLQYIIQITANLSCSFTQRSVVQSFNHSITQSFKTVTVGRGNLGRQSSSIPNPLLIQSDPERLCLEYQSPNDRFQMNLGPSKSSFHHRTTRYMQNPDNAYPLKGHPKIIISASLEPYKQGVTRAESNGCVLESFVPLSAGISTMERKREQNGRWSWFGKFLLVNGVISWVGRWDILALRGLVSFGRRRRRRRKKKRGR